MDISFLSLGYFIPIPRILQWIFHSYPYDISMRMIKPVRGHPMGCWNDGHMTNYQNWSTNQGYSPALYLPESVWILF